MKKVLVVLVVALWAFAGAAQAADWQFYGSARVNTFMIDKSKAGEDSTRFDQKLLSTSRIGARVKVSDTLTGRFEYGSPNGNANIRILWAQWDFGAGKLGVGQTYTPLNMFYSNQVYDNDTMLLLYGGVYSARQAQIKLKFGNFQISAVEPNDDFTDNGPAGTTTENRFPTIEAKYRFTGQNWHVQVAGGYNTFDVKSGGNSYGVDSYVAAVGGELILGPAYLRGNLFAGQNAGNLIWLDYDGAGALDGVAEFDGTGILDQDNVGCLAVAGYKLNDLVTLQAGYGYTNGDQDRTGIEDDVTSYYIQAAFTPAAGIRIVPEIGVIDYLDDAQGDVRYYGVRWQIAF